MLIRLEERCDCSSNPYSCLATIGAERAKEDWCNPRADDECTINDKKAPRAELKQYLPAVYELEALNSGGHCEYPICYDKNDKPVGIH